MRSVIAVGVVAAAGLEALAAAAWLSGDLAGALVLHAASSAVVAGSLRLGLVYGKGAWSFALPFGCAFFVPGLGALGLLAVAVAAPRRPGDSSRAREPFVRTPLPPPPEGDAPARPAAAGDDPLLPGERDANQAALVAVKHRCDPQAIALLWRALKDPEEEIRLLAFSLLESKVSAAYHRIQAHTEELETASEDRRGLLHTRLAFEHWELAWHGLVQGEVLGHELARAGEHVSHALKRYPRSAPIQLLRARVHLRRGQLEEADVALRCALALGIPGDSLRPYLAELAFRQKRFDDVRRHLAHPALPSGNSPAARVQRYWC